MMITEPHNFLLLSDEELSIIIKIISEEKINFNK